MGGFWPFSFFFFFPGVLCLVIHISALPTPFLTCQERALEVPTLTPACSEPATACGRLLCLYLRASLINLINQPVLVQRCGAARPRAAAPGCSAGAALTAILIPCWVPVENGKDVEITQICPNSCFCVQGRAGPCLTSASLGSVPVS